MALIKADSKATAPVNKFLPSPSYRSHYGAVGLGDKASSSSSTGAVTRACSELVRNACVKGGVEEAITTKLVALVNPLEGEQAQALQALYAKQLIGELKTEIRNDLNYSKDMTRFPALTQLMSTM